MSNHRLGKLMKRHKKIRAHRGSKPPGVGDIKPAVAAPNQWGQPGTVDRPDWAWGTDRVSIRPDEGGSTGRG